MCTIKRFFLCIDTSADCSMPNYIFFVMKKYNVTEEDKYFSLETYSWE